MTLTKIAAIASITTLVSTTAFAEPLYTAEAFTDPQFVPPFSISLAVTLGDSEQFLPVETISASVATGGATAVSNATASMIGGAGTSSSNGGATSDWANLSSQVLFNDNGFESSVGTHVYRKHLVRSFD